MCAREHVIIVRLKFVSSAPSANALSRAAGDLCLLCSVADFEFFRLDVAGEVGDVDGVTYNLLGRGLVGRLLLLLLLLLLPLPLLCCQLLGGLLLHRYLLLLLLLLRD